MNSFLQKSLLILTLCVLTACTQTTSTSHVYEPKPYVKITHPDWSKNAVMYQLNTRQFTPEGTFNAAKSSYLV